MRCVCDHAANGKASYQLLSRERLYLWGASIDVFADSLGIESLETVCDMEASERGADQGRAGDRFGCEYSSDYGHVLVSVKSFFTLSHVLSPSNFWLEHYFVIVVYHLRYSLPSMYNSIRFNYLCSIKRISPNSAASPFLNNAIDALPVFVGAKLLQKSVQGRERTQMS